jgi:small-conductance mechanosensitive channel
LIAGIFIFATKDYKIGDIVEIQDRQMPLFGKIDEITIRYIVLKTFDLRRVVIPNIQFMQSKIKTYTSEDIIRMDFTTAVSINSDVDKTIQTIKDEVNTLDFLTHKELTDVLIDSFDDKKIVLRIYFTFDPNGKVPGHIAKSQAEFKVLKLMTKNAFKII